MSEELKKKWSKVGHDFAALGTDLGKSIVSSIKTGVTAATEWASKDDEPKDEAEEAQAEKPKDEAPKAEE